MSADRHGPEIGPAADAVHTAALDMGFNLPPHGTRESGE